mmetsp:Transcript_76613/g.228306  ORF Transcript_76613/g.228306 Transcript_76613/m.228306 type:complete len:611 (+) Transcript_76613:58-1890(+)
MQGSVGREDRVLYLHPYHRCPRLGYKSAVPEKLQKIWSSKPSTSRGRKVEHFHPESLKRLHVRVENSETLMATKDSEVSIPLSLASVRCGSDCQSGVPLLAITPMGSKSTWCVLVLADLADVVRVMDRFGQLGAIRHDFHSLYRMEEEPLGQGGFATIFAAKNRRDTTQVGGDCAIVAKVAKNGERTQAEQPTDDARPGDLLYEVTMLASVQAHANVVRLHGLFHTVDTPGPKWIMALERCAGGDLHNAVRADRFTEEGARDVMLGLLSALRYVHSLDILHRDVKPENILLASDGRSVLADFGIACHISDEVRTVKPCGSPGYVAPEVFSFKRYGQKVDIFSSGCVLYFIFTGRPPFVGSTMQEVVTKTTRYDITFDHPVLRSVSKACKDLIKKLTNKPIETRSSVETALAHPWITQEESLKDPVFPIADPRPTSAEASKGKEASASEPVPGECEDGRKKEPGLATTTEEVAAGPSHPQPTREAAAGPSRPQPTHVADEVAFESEGFRTRTGAGASSSSGMRSRWTSPLPRMGTRRSSFSNKSSGAASNKQAWFSLSRVVPRMSFARGSARVQQSGDPDQWLTPIVPGETAVLKPKERPRRGEKVHPLGP